MQKSACLMLFFLIVACSGSSSSSDEGKNDASDGWTASSNQHFRGTITWLTGPTVSTYENQVEIVLEPVNGEAIADVTEVKPWMSVHGHGTDVEKQLISNKKKTDSGGMTFSVSGIYFIMSGPWELEVTAQNESGSVSDVVIYRFDVP